MNDNYNYTPKGIGYLRRKLLTVRRRGLLRYSYYEMKDGHMMPKIAIPEELSRSYRSQLGWCTKAVDSLADRLVVTGFENDGLGMAGIFEANNADILYDSAILGSLISACSFIYISKNSDGSPRLQVIDGTNATGVIDPVTGLLREGYAVLERDPDTEKVITEAYFEAGRTTYYMHGQPITYEEANVGYPLLVPLPFRPDARRPFGHSRISRACMDLQDKAKDVLTRAAVSAEFYSYPQKYILGLSDETELDGSKAMLSSMLRADQDENGRVPTVGQFSQQSMSPHLDHFKVYASNFCGETGLTMDDIGFVSDNPSSAEAIKASHESLRVTATKAQKNFGVGFLNAGYLAKCLQDDIPYERTGISTTKVRWKPVIEPDAAMLSSIGDGAIKINQAIPGFFDKQTLSGLTGIE